MILIKIGTFEVNPDHIKFISKDERGYEIIFDDDLVIRIANDTNEYVELSAFITKHRENNGFGSERSTEEYAATNGTEKVGGV
jgi:hypothetical protein